MKKALLSLLGLVLALCISAPALVSCDSEDANEFIMSVFLASGTGEWQPTEAKISENGTYVSWTDYVNTYVMESIRPTVLETSMVFKADGTATFNGLYGIGATLKYTVSGTTLSFTKDDNHIYDIEVLEPNIVDGTAIFKLYDRQIDKTIWMKVAKVKEAK